MADTYTTNVGITMLATGDTGWGDICNGTFAKLDSLSPLGGLCVSTFERPTSTTLKVSIAAGTFVDATTGAYVAVSATSVTCTASITNFIYLTEDGAAHVNTTGFPTGTNIVRLAIVAAGTSSIATITDARSPLASAGSPGATGGAFTSSITVDGSISVVDGGGATLGGLNSDGTVSPGIVAAASAADKSIFLDSSNANALSYKNGSGATTAVGTLAVGSTPISGGTTGNYLTVGAGGLLQESSSAGASMAIGGAVSGSTGAYVLAENGSGNLAETGMTWDASTSTLTYGGDLVGSVGVDNLAYRTSIGNSASLTGDYGTALGYAATAAYSSVAAGSSASASGQYAGAFGPGANAGYDFSYAIGHAATTTATHQIMLGTSSETVVVPGNLSVTGTVSFGASTVTGLDTTGTGTDATAAVGSTSRFVVSVGGIEAFGVSSTTIDVVGGLSVSGDTSLTGDLAIGGNLLGNAPRSMFDHISGISNSGTTETDLFSDTIAGGTLAANGAKVTAAYGLTVFHSTSTKQIKVYFGGSVIFDSGALSYSATGYVGIEAFIIRDSSSSVRYVVRATFAGATTSALASVGTLSGLTLTGSTIIKITGAAAGTGAASGDVTAVCGSVWYLPAA